MVAATRPHTQTTQTDEAPVRFVGLPILFDALALEKLPVPIQQQIAAVDDCLPQTQCGLCEHPDGCLPYAAAIVTEGEAHNKCVPGGQPVTDAIARVLDRTALTAAPSKWSVDTHTGRPHEVRAIIREDDCIGCTKCIPACPVDAIIGTGKHMHTIMTDLCTGCELCLAPCPVDCIDLEPINRDLSDAARQAEEDALRTRYHTHLRRVADQLNDRSNTKPVVSMVEAKINNATNQSIDISEDEARNTIKAAKLRSQIKKLEKQLAVRANPQKAQQLSELQAELAQLNL